MKPVYSSFHSKSKKMIKGWPVIKLKKEEFNSDTTVDIK